MERRGAGAGGVPGPSAPPEKPLRALLLQVLYSTRSERLLREQRDYNLLFWWFVGLNMDDPIWDPTVFTKKRERLLAGESAQAFFARVLAQARQHGVLSDEHVTVDGTLIEAWASLGSFTTRGTATRPTIRAIPRWTFTGSGGARARTYRRPIPPRGWAARARATRPRSPTRGMSSGTIATAWQSRAG